MIELPLQHLIALRDELQRRGQRPSMLLPTARPDVVEAIGIAEQYGAMCEVMFLMMVADGKMLNVEREVLRGALDVISEGRVRTTHMDAMLDDASRKLGREGVTARLDKLTPVLAEDDARAETTLVLAAAVAAADGAIVPEEHALFRELTERLDVSDERAKAILKELVGS